MTDVPSNLIPVTLTNLPVYAGSSPLGYFPYVVNGVTYCSTIEQVVAAINVPPDRIIQAGAGLLGGGTLASTVTISVDLATATPNAGNDTPQVGTSDKPAREDHVHPSVNLASASETQGVLPLAGGGTGSGLSPAIGAVAYSAAAELALTSVGADEQVLVAHGPGNIPNWGYRQKVITSGTGAPSGGVDGDIYLQYS